MIQKITHFIISRSERSRKAIAGMVISVAGVMLFFAWTAGVSARLPLLGSEFDSSPRAIVEGSNSEQSAPSTDAGGGEQSRATPSTSSGQAAVSPMKGLIDSFQDLVRLFRGEYAAAPTVSSTRASSSPSQPIDELFNKISDEPQPATSTEIIDTATTADNQPQIEDLPPIEDLPGI